MTSAPLPEGWKTVRLIINGRVQGVSYRWWTVGEATTRNLNGWVRNRRDGSVEVLASGPIAQVDDLIEGRHIALASRLSPAQPFGRGAGGGTAAALPAIVELLKTAQESLDAGRCDDYYGKQMSPNFRRVTGKKALEALVASCQNSMGTRQLLLSTVHIVRGLEPRYENESQRAVYDLSGQGLPFQSFSLEVVDKRWYVAE